MKQKKLWKRLIAVGACSVMMFAMPVGVFAAESETATSRSVSETKSTDYGELQFQTNVIKKDDGSVWYDVYLMNKTTTGYSVEFNEFPTVTVDGVDYPCNTTDSGCFFFFDAESAKTPHDIVVNYNLFCYDSEIPEGFIIMDNKTYTTTYIPDGYTEGDDGSGDDSTEEVDCGTPNLTVKHYETADGKVTYEIVFPQEANEKGFWFSLDAFLGVTIDGQPYSSTGAYDTALTFDKEFLKESHDIVFSYALSADNPTAMIGTKIDRYDVAFTTEALGAGESDGNTDTNTGDSQTGTGDDSKSDANTGNGSKADANKPGTDNSSTQAVSSESTAPKTGDPTSVAGLIGGMLASMGGIGTVIYKKRK